MTTEPMLNGPIDFGPQYAEGQLSIENVDQMMDIDFKHCTVGVQVAWDGRIWLCVNGVAWIRFKPTSGKWRTSEVIE